MYKCSECGEQTEEGVTQFKKIEEREKSYKNKNKMECGEIIGKISTEGKEIKKENIICPGCFNKNKKKVKK